MSANVPEAIPELERAIVGALLRAQTVTAAAAIIESAGDVEAYFSRPETRLAWRMGAQLVGAGQLPDAVILLRELQQRGRNGSAAVFIDTLLSEGAAVRTPNVSAWVAVLRAESKTRLPGPSDPDAPAAERETTPVARVYGMREFLGLTLSPRAALLVGPSGAPVLRQKDSVMIYAPTGHGKSWLVQGAALAIASRGRFLRWSAPERRRVLHVDGELPAGTLQERFRILLPSVEPAEEPDLYVLAADVQDEPLPSLASPAGQARIEEHLAGVSLLVLDNISTLMPTLDENDASAWEPAQQWLLSLRRRGITVVLAHHAGRAGHARGTSRREDVLDLVVRLARPSDYAPDQGARFEVTFQKARGVSGADVEPFEAWLSGGEWRLADVTGKNREAALELLEQGARPGEVAEAIGISRAQAFRYQREGRKEGRLSDPRVRGKRAVS